MYFNLRNPKNNSRMLKEPKPLKKKLNTFESKISENIAPTAKMQTLNALESKTPGSTPRKTHNLILNY